MRIMIMGLPFGPGPDYIKRMFIGLSFQASEYVDAKFIKPIAVDTGKSVMPPNERIYGVSASQVISVLKAERPEAYKWFVNKSILFIDGKFDDRYRMYFQASACEVETSILAKENL